MPLRGTQPPGNRNKRPPAPNPANTPWHNDQVDDHESETPWLMSYLDFMTVLVALFVLLYATEKARGIAEKRSAEAEIAAAAEPAEDQAAQEPPTAETEESPQEPPEPAASDSTLASLPELPDSTGIAASGFLEPQPLSTADIFLAAQAAAEATAAATAEPLADAQDSTAAESPPVPPAEAVVEKVEVEAETPARPDPLATLAPLADRITVKQDAEKLLIEIDDTILFPPASAELTGDGKALLDKLQPVLLEHPGRITVEGHTDGRPIATAQFPSNWELSTARASIVTRHLIGLGVAADRVFPVGRADTQPRADNATAEGRAQNRRVGIILHTE